MTRPSPAPRHDPYWDLDGAGARRSRTQRRLQRSVLWVVALAILAAVLSQVPTIDTAYLTTGGGRPILAAAMMILLAAAALLALARVRHSSRQ